MWRFFGGSAVIHFLQLSLMSLLGRLKVGRLGVRRECSGGLGRGHWAVVLVLAAAQMKTRTELKAHDATAFLRKVYLENTQECISKHMEDSSGYIVRAQ